MIKQLTSKKNLNEAYLRVYRNKGAAGVDNIQVTELKAILKFMSNIQNSIVKQNKSPSLRAPCFMQSLHSMASVSLVTFLS